ncbi:MAG: helix-turn-helix domain-containing protein [Candidatus Peribacteraceae bacterium]|nr:helix-turn-helix domain-containing protein [Candidatus Peribacteraceae bacterium]MDD5742321.1 helix-turn-helix domain-containing protein [Candidatus Peribacteraceae bacterium]
MNAQLPVPAPQDDNQARKYAAAVAGIVDTIASLPKFDVAPLARIAESHIASLRKIADTVAVLPKMDFPSLAGIGQSHLSAFTAIADALGPALKAIDVVRPSCLAAIQEFTSPKWMNMAQEMAESQTRALESVMKMLDTPSFSSMLYDEPIPVYTPPPRNTVTHVHETHVTIHIQTLVIGKEEKDDVVAPVPLPEAGCLRLDTFIALRHEGDESGIWYLLHGQWQFAHLPPLAVSVLLYLYQMRLYPEKYAQRVKDIADAMGRKQESISRELRRIRRLCVDLEIKPVLEQTSEQRWCMSLRLGCCKHLWS